MSDDSRGQALLACLVFGVLGTVLLGFFHYTVTVIGVSPVSTNVAVLIGQCTLIMAGIVAFFPGLICIYAAGVCGCSFLWETFVTGLRFCFCR